MGWKKNWEMLGYRKRDFGGKKLENLGWQKAIGTLPSSMLRLNNDEGGILSLGSKIPLEIGVRVKMQ